MKDSEKQYIHPTRIFKTPEELHNTWQRYKQSIKDEAKEWPQIQYVGRDGVKKVDLPKMPYHLSGFKRYCYDQGIGHIEQYFTNQDDLYDDFIGITTRIKCEIEEVLTTGGLLGHFNPNLTARINGYADKQQITDSTIKIEGLPKDIEEDLNEE